MSDHDVVIRWHRWRAAHDEAERVARVVIELIEADAAQDAIGAAETEWEKAHGNEFRAAEAVLATPAATARGVLLKLEAAMVGCGYPGEFDDIRRRGPDGPAEFAVLAIWDDLERLAEREAKIS